ncbi:MAG: type II toxin-antitoxin system VapC family toxin [Candidatus Acidiferrales bacterium]
MLYLDASALVKRYIQEAGSETVNLYFERDERIFISVLSYAEVQAALGRKRHNGDLRPAEFQRARQRFLEEFVFHLELVDVDTKTMSAIPDLVERHPIRGADAVQLSSVLWLRDMIRLVPSFIEGEKQLEFVTADERLAGFAREAGLTVSAIS